MRLITLFSIMFVSLAACAARRTLIRASPSHDIKLTFWNGDTVTDPGGLGEPCDRGCLAQAEDHLRALGDAGTVMAVYEAQSGVSKCLIERCGRE